MEEHESLPMWGTVEPSERAPSVMHSPTKHSAHYIVRDRPQMPVIDATPTDIAGVWAPSAAVTETGTPVHRAYATVIRATPIMVLMALVAIPLAWFLESGWMLGLAIVGGLMLFGYLGTLYIDLSWNSPGSTEAKRISAAYRLKRMELKNSHELRRAIVESYLAHLEGDDRD